MSEALARITGERPRILIVEDDTGMRRSMQLLLQGRGYDVRAYAAADTMLLDEHLDTAACLVADYRLGARDGISVLRHLRKRGWMGPAILVTAYSTQALQWSAREAGFELLLEKPFKDNALAQAVTRLTRSSAQT